MPYLRIIKALEKNGHIVHFFSTSTEAINYLVREIHGYTVGFGDSATIESLNLSTLLAANNTIIYPSPYSGSEFISVAKKTLLTDIFLTSANALAETGELINIDGTGNRVAGSLFGHKKVIFICGTNKIMPTIEKAIWRARNIAAPKNAQRLGYKTPCAINADRCYDCSAPERICNTLNIHLKSMKNTVSEVIIIAESLGF